MPFFEFTLSVSANTPASAPSSLDVALSPGKLVEVEVLFPRGCVQLVHTTINRGGHQLYPLNRDGNIAGENGPVRWQESLILDDDPYVLRLVAWSDDDTFPHTLTYRFNLLSIEDVKADQLLSELQLASQRRALAPREAEV